MSVALKKLNLGCGSYPKDGFLNVDFVEADGMDVVLDLNEFPYPFQVDEFEAVHADHLLEHLAHPFEMMREIHRVTRDGAEVVIRVPHCSRGFTHAEHQRGFDVTFPLYFQPQFPGGYQGVEFVLDGLRLTWFAQPYLKKQVLSPTECLLGSAFGACVDLIANLSPALCSRLWCYWVGGFEEIEFRFRTRKSVPG